MKNGLCQYFPSKYKKGPSTSLGCINPGQKPFSKFRVSYWLMGCQDKIFRRLTHRINHIPFINENTGLRKSRIRRRQFNYQPLFFNRIHIGVNRNPVFLQFIMQGNSSYAKSTAGISHVSNNLPGCHYIAFLY